MAIAASSKRGYMNVWIVRLLLQMPKGVQVISSSLVATLLDNSFCLRNNDNFLTSYFIQKNYKSNLAVLFTEMIYKDPAGAPTIL